MTGHNLVSGGRMKKSFLALFVCVVLAAAFWPAPSAARDYDVQKDAASTADLAAVNGTGPAVQMAQVQPPRPGMGRLRLRRLRDTARLRPRDTAHHRLRLRQ